MNAFFTRRGLDSLALICGAIPDRGSIAVPDFICPEVAQQLRRYFYELRPYHITDGLQVDWSTVWACGAFYSIDYFGKEAEIEGVAHGSAIIRDGVWLPYPMRPLGENEFWFNSFRKFAWPARGSLMLWPPGAEFGNRIGINPIDLAMVMRAGSQCEIDERWERRCALFDRLHRYAYEYWMGDFPSVLPLTVPNRDAVAARLAEQGIILPGMWKASPGLSNTLYDKLMLVPCDSRWSVEETEARGEAILRAIEEAAQ